MYPTFRAADNHLLIGDGYGKSYRNYSDDVGLNGGAAHYSADGLSLAVALDIGDGSYALGITKTFGVAADPCADGSCAPMGSADR